MSKKIIRAGALILTTVLLAAGCTRSEYIRTPDEYGSYSSANSEDSGYSPNENSSSGQSSDSGSSPQSPLTLELRQNASWKEGNNYCGTVEVVVKNSGGEVSGWKASFTVPSGFSITNSWGAAFSADGTTVTVTSDSNASIPQNGSVTAGFNYSSPSDFSFSAGTASGDHSSVQSGGSSGNSQNNDHIPNENVSGTVAELLERVPEAKQGDDWLHTDGRRILDKNGKEVWITGVNWFGYNTGTNTFDGLWNSQLAPTVKSIADHGFNLIRVPISAQLINQWAAGEYPRANYNNAYNTELNDMNSLQIFDYFLKLAEQNGMKVMPDIHSAETDASGHNVNLWYTSNVSVEEYYHALEWLADRYKNNDTIIAVDIKNEPHGKPNETNKAIWNDSTDINNWKYTAETAAKRILAKNPNLLIMVEGTEIFPISPSNMDYHSADSKDYYFNWWGGNLRGVKNYPVNLGQYQNKLVYSPHDYGPTVYEQPWFQGGYDYDSLMKDCWQDNWFYIYEDNTAPLLIGEWGGFMREPNLKWMTCMRQLIKTYHLNHTFWCFNANSGDTGGLVLDDFKTWDSEKYAFVKEVLWQEGGKFVGLDHEIPLGENGITLTKAKGL
ncbi:MAG: cellulase family glycosylhydrolase [Oscillospiraceae bacterium]|nr:cellulase family glycosylhydrolase [Oscillospiraceae bacterium]